MQEKHKYLAKNIGLFALSGFVPKALSFFLVPLYTSVLTTAEYGVSDLITTTAMLLVPIFSLDIQDAAMRYALDKDCDNRSVFSVGFSTVLWGTFAVSAILLVVSLFHIPGFDAEYLFFTALMFFVTAGSNVFSLFCRGIDEVRAVAVSSIVNSVITLTCNIVFLTVFRWGLTGYLMANTIGSAFAMVYMFVSARLYRYIDFKPDRGLRTEMYLYSFPLIFSVVAWWVNSASDRYILSWICGVGVSGVYAVAYKIPSILSMFGNVFSQAWSISAIKEFDPDDSDGFFGGTFGLMSFAMSLACSAVMIFDIPLAWFLYANDFFEAWRFVPPLLMSVVFDVLCQFIGGIFTATKDTKTLSFTTISGALVNVVLNFALIPIFGAMGAAMATMLGYGGVLVARIIALRKHIQMRVSWRKVGFTYALLFVQLVVSEFGVKLIPLQVVLIACMIYVNRHEFGKVLATAKNVLPGIGK